MISVVADSGQVEIGDPWLIEGSLVILCRGDTLEPDVDYHWSDLTVRWIADGRAAVGDTVLIRWHSAHVTDQLTYTYYQPAVPDTSDSSYAVQKPIQRFDPLGSWGNIRRSGTLTRGIRFDPDGSSDVLSGMHLELSGRPTAGVVVEAVLDDRSLPATGSGGSTTLAELDRLLFRIKTPHLTAQLGDWDIHQQIGRYGNFSRRLKGGYLSVEYPAVQTEIAAAGSDNSFRTIIIQGRDGDQGPYELTDRFGIAGVSVVAGSEKVHLDGVLLRRGRRGDYVIDYGGGSITFNPTITIHSDSRIEIEYEYSDETYSRYFYAATAKTVIDEGLTIEAMTAIEGRNGDHPLAFDWTDDWRLAVSDAGDDPYGARVPGIDSVGIGLGDYVWSESLDVVEFSQPDSLGRPTGYLTVEFSFDSTGGYIREYDTSLQLFYYRWVGIGRGNWSPVRFIPLPERNDLHDLLIRFERDHWKMEAEAALSNYDRNTLSATSDDDNIGSAWRWEGNYRSDDGLSLTTAVNHKDQYFHPLSGVDEVDHRYLWDLPDSDDLSETEMTAKVGFGPSDKFRLTGVGGLLERGDWFTGRRYGVNGNGRIKLLDISAQIDRTDGDDRSEDQSNVRNRIIGRIQTRSGRLRPEYGVRMEDRQVTAGDSVCDGYRFWEQDIGATYELSQNEDVACQFLYRRDDRFDGENIRHRSDIRSLKLGWHGRRVGVGGWSVDMLHHHQTYVDQQSVTATSAALEAFVRPPESAWTGRMDYILATGNQRAGVQTARYVGYRKGSYRREGDRYVPDPDGDFEMIETLTDTLRQVSRVNSHIQIDWKPRRSVGQPYPLGISRLSTRFETELTTTEDSPWRGFLLDPTAFRTDEVVSARWNWLEDICFLEGAPTGDGKLTLRRDEGRDRALSGGETYLIEAISFRLRNRVTEMVKLRTEPLWERMRRWGIVFDEARSNVVKVGGEVEITVKSAEIEYGLEYGYTHHRDAVDGIELDQRRLTPRCVWTTMTGAIRLEGDWRLLTATNSSAGYDLTGGWAVGDNWSVSVTADYQIRSNLTLNGLYRGVWRGTAEPSHIGMIELTASL